MFVVAIAATNVHKPKEQANDAPIMRGPPAITASASADSEEGRQPASPCCPLLDQDIHTSTGQDDDMQEVPLTVRRWYRPVIMAWSRSTGTH
jgi:hypothetical protein